MRLRSSESPESTAGAPLPAAIALWALLAASCTGQGDGGPGLPAPGYPPEPGPEAFTGLSYPPAQGPLPRPGSLSGPVWIIGIDGATWDLIRPMAERGELPAFEALMREGAWGVLRSEEPTISPALWATIATGVPRFRHGIENFRVKVPATYELVQAGPPDRREPALWELVGAAGGRSAVIGWFGSFPAEEIPGWYVSKGFDPEAIEPGQVHPPSLEARLEGGAAVTMRRRDLEEIGWNEDYRRTLVEDARVLAALRVILDRDRPDLVALHLAGIDVVQHVAWHHMDPQSHAFPEDGGADPDLAGVIPAYYRYMDHTLDRIRGMAPPGTTLLVVSDHGGGPMGRDEAFVPDLPPLLEAMGLMNGERGTLFTLSQPYRWEKPIWLNLFGVESAGIVEEGEAAATASALRDRLASLRTDAGEPVFSSVRDLAGMPGWRRGDPALSVRFAYAVRSARSVVDGDRLIPASLFVSRLPGVSGSHRPEGILILRGPGIRPGRLAEESTLYNIAPTALYLLGLHQDARMLAFAPPGGGVLVSAIDPELLRTHPVRMIGAYPGTDRSALLRAAPGHRPEPPDPAHERDLERLRSLGYVR